MLEGEKKDQPDSSHGIIRGEVQRSVVKLLTLVGRSQTFILSLQKIKKYHENKEKLQEVLLLSHFCCSSCKLNQSNQFGRLYFSRWVVCFSVNKHHSGRLSISCYSTTQWVQDGRQWSSIWCKKHFIFKTVTCFSAPTFILKGRIAFN